MKSWKEGFWLATFELKVDLWKRIANQILLVCLFSFIVISMFDGYIENNVMGFDIVFLLLFFYSASWALPKAFQYQKISQNTYASPYFTLLNSIPIQRGSVIRSRFIVSFINTVPIQIVILLLLYYFSPEIQNMLTATEYIAFSIIWLGIGLSFGSLLPASDVGDHVTKLGFIMISITFVFFGMLILFLFNVLVSGVVYSTITLATKWPLYSVIFTIIITIVSLKSWIKYAENKVDRMDYFV
ncbi:hypothetical protein [Alkalibacillus haloalkaliphilus]|uniref:hypothetical protein n=1 Tax=Alkalibacillus haloalkaliphilus TaxID=94136 RepID=UPI0002EED4E3|nr:hypothetical protein [Alkalibacillus haloalkaliphilus]